MKVIDPGHTYQLAQEVLRALIARAIYVDQQIPDPETQEAMRLLKRAVYLLECRAKRRRGELLHPGNELNAWLQDTCQVCGHIQCTKHLGEDQ